MRSRPGQYYIFQKENYFPYHCGVIAVFNLLCRLNVLVNLQILFELNGRINKCGMSENDLNFLIEKVNIEYNLDIHKENIDIDTIDERLSNRNYGILLFCANKITSFGHFAFIEKYKSKTFRIINFSFDHEIKIITRKHLELLIKSKHNFENPKFWICSNKHH